MSSSNSFNVLDENSPAVTSATVAADTFMPLPPTRIHSWADETQEEVDAAEATKVKVKDKLCETEDGERWQTITKPKHSPPHTEKVKDGPEAIHEDSTLVKEDSVATPSTTLAMVTPAFETVEDITNVQDATVTETQERTGNLPATNIEATPTKPEKTDNNIGGLQAGVSMDKKDVITPLAPIVVADDSVGPADIAKTRVSQIPDATPAQEVTVVMPAEEEATPLATNAPVSNQEASATSSWDDFVDSTRAIFNPLRLTSYVTTPSYAETASSVNDESKVIRNTNSEFLVLQDAKQDKGKVSTTPNKVNISEKVSTYTAAGATNSAVTMPTKKMLSGAQRRNATKAAATAEGSFSDVTAEMIVTAIGGIEDVQHATSKSDEVNELDSISSKPASQPTVVDVKVIEDFPATTAEPIRFDESILPSPKPSTELEAPIAQDTEDTTAANSGSKEGLSTTPTTGLDAYKYTVNITEQSPTTTDNVEVSVAAPQIVEKLAAQEIGTTDLDFVEDTSKVISVDKETPSTETPNNLLDAPSNIPVEYETFKVTPVDAPQESKQPLNAVQEVVIEASNCASPGNDKNSADLEASPHELFVAHSRKNRTKAERRAAKERATAATTDSGRNDHSSLALIVDKEATADGYTKITGKAAPTNREKNFRRREQRKAAIQSARAIAAATNAEATKVEKEEQDKPGNQGPGTMQESVIISRKKNRPSGAQRRKAAKSTVAAAALIPVAPITSPAAPPVGLRIAGYTVPWFALLGLSMITLAILATGLYWFI